MSDMATNTTYASDGDDGRAKQRWRVGYSADIAEKGRLVVEAGDTAVGIFRIDGELYAYENTCSHMGGPVCQGLMVPRVIEKLNEQQQVIASDFDASDMHIVCPWHGFEYSIKSGRHAGKQEIRLRAIAVEEDEEGVYVYV